MGTTERLLLLSGLLAGMRLSSETSSDGIEELAETAGVLELLGGRRDSARKFPRARRAYLFQAALGMMRLEALRQISKAMRERAIDMIPLKGMAYALMFEQGGPVRDMTDRCPAGLGRGIGSRSLSRCPVGSCGRLG